MRATFFMTLLGVGGCGGGDGPPPPDSDADTDADTDVDSDADTDSDTDDPWDVLETEFGPYDLAGGEERDFCEWYEIESDVPLYVTRFAQTNDGYVHHFNLHATTIEHAPGIDACPDFIGAFVDSKDVYPGTRDQGPAEMPAGVAVVLEPRQPMFLNLHLFNGGDTADDETFRLSMDLGDPAREWIAAGTIALTDLTIVIPPNGQAEAQVDCVFPVGVEANVFSMTSHSHGRSVLVTANLWDGKAPGDEVYRSTSWSDPAIVSLDPPLLVSEGEGFTASCFYENHDDREVTYGGTADDEMCFVFGHYYPGPALIPCID